MSRTVRELLSDPLKGTNRTQGVLTYLFRHVLMWRQVNQFTWNKRARVFFEKPHNKNKKDKGNLNKALVNDEFTWGTFKDSVDFLNPMAAVFIIELTWASGDVSKYTIVLDPAEDESDPEINSFIVDKPSDVFVKPSKKTNTLTRLFRKIMAEEGVTAVKWEELLQQFARNPLNAVKQTDRDISAAISGLQRELLSDRMSWNSFRRGMLILGPIRQTFTLDLKWSNNKGDSSYHSVAIDDPMYAEQNKAFDAD